MLTREAILGNRHLRREEVEVWGGTVFVREMSGRERDEFESTHVQNPNVNLRARMAIAVVCDGDGKPLFTLEDAEALGETSGAELGRIFDVAVRLNGMRKADVDELEKNSSRIRSGFTPST